MIRSIYICNFRKILGAVFEKIPKNLIFWGFLGPKKFFGAKIANRAPSLSPTLDFITLCKKAKKSVQPMLRKAVTNIFSFFCVKNSITPAGVTSKGEKSEKKFFFGFFDFFRELSHSDAKNRKKIFWIFLPLDLPWLARNLKRPQNGWRWNLSRLVSMEKL